MVQEASYEKISPTAKLVAHIRSFTDIPFTKEIAAASGAVKDGRVIRLGRPIISFRSYIVLSRQWDRSPCHEFIGLDGEAGLKRFGSVLAKRLILRIYFLI